MIFKYIKDKDEKKIVIINLLLFIVLIFSFFQINTYLQEINFELQYKNYEHYNNFGIKDSDIEINNDTIKIKDYSEDIDIGFNIIIPLIISFILIIENLFTFLSLVKKKLTKVT